MLCVGAEHLVKPKPSRGDSMDCRVLHNIKLLHVVPMSYCITSTSDRRVMTHSSISINQVYINYDWSGAAIRSINNRKRAGARILNHLNYKLWSKFVQNREPTWKGHESFELHIKFYVPMNIGYFVVSETKLTLRLRTRKSLHGEFYFRFLNFQLRFPTNDAG